MSTRKVKRGNAQNASSKATLASGNNRPTTPRSKPSRPSRAVTDLASSEEEDDDEDEDDDSDDERYDHNGRAEESEDEETADTVEDDDDDEEGDDDDDDDVTDNAIAVNNKIRKKASRSGSNNLDDSDSPLSDIESSAADSDGYGAVEDVSDSEDSIAAGDEKRMLRSTEQELIEEFEFEHEPRASVGMEHGSYDAVFRRPSLISEDSHPDEGETALDYSMDPFGGLSNDDINYREMLQDAEELFGNDDLASWRTPGTVRPRENSEASVAQKRVRFETTPSRASSTASDDDDEDEDPMDVFPDIFSGIDPIPHSNVYSSDYAFDNVANNDNESVFDFEDDEYAIAANDVSGDDSDASVTESESEGGETTDEESTDEQVARMAAIRKAAGKSPPPAARSAPTTPIDRVRPPSLHRRALTARMTKTRNAKDLPRAGTFSNDPSKAIVTADSSGHGIKLTCPTKPPAKDREYWERARQAIGSREGSSPNGPVSWTKRTPRAPGLQRPLTARSTLGTLFDGNLDFLHENDHIGIANSLDPRAPPRMANLTSFASAMTETETSDNDSTVNIADFIEMDSSSDSEMGDAAPMSPMDNDMPMTEWGMQSSPMPQRKRKGPREPITSGGLLDHFDQQRGLVSSFRNNQQHARHFSSLPSHPTRRAQMSESNALQKGRRSAANTPMTPARKQRPSVDLSLTGSGVRKANNAAAAAAAAASSPLTARHRRRSRGSSLSGLAQTLALDRFLASEEENKED